MFKTNALPAAADTDDRPKSAFDKLLTTTPVVMTVVATLLAGLSSSEMTKAQYFRSLAAQNQSKVGDQWGFFQAKRARGTSHALTAKLLRAVSDSSEVDAVALQASAARMALQLQRAQTQVQDLVEQLANAGLGAGGEPLRRSAARLLNLTGDKAARANSLKKQLAEALATADVQNALACATADEPPTILTSGVSAKAADPQIHRALEAVAQRKTEQETHPLVAPIGDDDPHDAIRATEADAKAFDDAGKPVNKGLGRLDELVEEEVRLAGAFYRSVREVQSALEQLPAAGGKALADARQSVKALAENATTLRQAINELSTSFMAAQLRYHGWRYDREARDNQVAAGLYEIEVRKSGWHSERHRRRSAYFFYGMLAAQAGVTTATLALAVRLRSVLWGLGSAAGVVAIAIAGYVYLYV